MLKRGKTPASISLSTIDSVPTYGIGEATGGCLNLGSFSNNTTVADFQLGGCYMRLAVDLGSHGEWFAADFTVE
jgi:hypothetical protein